MVVDVGPSLGALNRSVVIGTDHVLTPTAADLFSLFALENIADWITHWGRLFIEALDRVAETYGEDAVSVGLVPQQQLRASYLGFTIQQYVTKSSADGQRRGVKATTSIASRYLRKRGSLLTLSDRLRGYCA